MQLKLVLDNESLLTFLVTGKYRRNVADVRSGRTTTLIIIESFDKSKLTAKKRINPDVSRLDWYTLYVYILELSKRRAIADLWCFTF